MKQLDIDNLNRQSITKLSQGDLVSMSGTLLTTRDATCKRIMENKNNLPFDLKNKFVFFCGPTPTPPGKIIGSCGPTTSSRMQSFFYDLINLGVVGFVGKGEVAPEYQELLQKNGAVLISVTGGIGALLAKKVTHSCVTAYEDLGPEAVYELEVKDFPGVVE